MTEKVAMLGIKREPGFVYFVKAGDVWRKPTGGNEPEKVATAGITQEAGYIYALDADGDVSRTELAASREARLPKPPARAAATFEAAFEGLARHAGKARHLTVAERKGGLHRGRHALTVFDWTALDTKQRNRLVKSRLKELAAQHGKAWAKRFVPFALVGAASNPVPPDALGEACDAVLLLDLQEGGAVVVLENPDSDEPVEYAASASELTIATK
jgi:hypothetical protein